MIQQMTHNELVDLVRKVLMAKSWAKDDCVEASERKARWRRYKELESQLKRYVWSSLAAPWQEPEFYDR